MSRLDRARGTGDQAVPADAVQDRLPAKGGQLLAGHVVPDERGRAVHQVAGDRTAAVQAEHHDAVQFPAPQRQPMTAVQRQEESDNVLQVNTTAALNVTTTYVVAATFFSNIRYRCRAVGPGPQGARTIIPSPRLGKLFI